MLGNPYPPVIPELEQHSNSLLNILLENARKQHRESKMAKQKSTNAAAAANLNAAAADPNIAPTADSNAAATASTSGPAPKATSDSTETVLEKGAEKL